MFGDGRKMEYKVSEELDLLEIMIYEWSKESIENINQLRNKYSQYEEQVDFGKIYRCIVDYRISKYGTSSIVQYRGKTKEECIKNQASAAKRRRLKIGAKYRQWKEQ